MRVFRSIRAALLLLSVVLGACGGVTRVVYDNADAAVLLLADRYLDLEGEQWKLARGSIGRFHAWHRRTELPRYASLLQSAAGRVARGLDRDDVEWAMQSLRARYAVLVAAAVQESAPLLDTLDADNVAALERHFAAEDRKRVRDRLTGDPPKRERDRVAAIVKRFEEWTGPLAEPQKELVRRFVRSTADYPRHAHETRLRKQRGLVELLRRDIRAANGSPAEDLRAHLLGWEDEGAPKRDYQARFVQLIVDLDRTLTPSQRASVIERLSRYVEDCRQLERRG